MSLDRKHENENIEEMKAKLLKQFQSGVDTANGGFRIAAAESARAYGILVQTQLALENKQ
ncbi:MAG TPA: hypothetical protein VII95_20085 [Terriglobales bacterium]|jgi:hypothetical protein